MKAEIEASRDKASNGMIARLSGLVLAALLAALPMGARAAQPTTASEASARAQHYRELAGKYKLLGGTGYKLGHVQQAELAAGNCETVAAELQPVVHVQPVVIVDATPSDEGGRATDTTRALAVLAPTTPAPPAAPKCPAF